MAKALDITEGIMILQKYCMTDMYHVHAEHDIIYAGPNYADVPPSENDEIKLQELGWFVDESGNWSIFT